jgi:hypothetical protein
MKTLFFTLGSILFGMAIFMLLFPEPPVGETVTASRLSTASDLVRAYPKEATVSAALPVQPSFPTKARDDIPPEILASVARRGRSR